MSWFVYLLRCNDDLIYTGITWNLQKRITEHNSGKFQSFTRSRLPVKLVYWERHANRFDADRRERQIKGWSRAKKESLITSLH